MKRIGINLLFLCFLLISTTQAHAWTYACGGPAAPCSTAPIQGATLFNSQTTGAATTAVTVTIPGTQGNHVHVYQVEGRCNTGAATSGLTITDNAVTIWSSVGTEVGSAANFMRQWPTGLTGGSGTQVVITLAACTAGTGTLIVEADRW